MQETNKLKHFPISFFSIVMGLAGLTIAWEKTQTAFGMTPRVNLWLITGTSLVFAILAALYAVKLARYKDAVLVELRHPIKLNFFPAVSMSLLLLSVAFLPIEPGIGRVLWILGAALHLSLTIYILNLWIHHEHFEIHHLNPAWFIPAVGNALVPVAGVPLGYIDVSWFFFSIGLVFWIILLTIIFYRVLFHHPLPEKLTPTLFIMIAPPAVGFVAYLQLTGELDAFARILYYTSLFFTLLLLSQVKRFAKVRFSLSWWAYSFPLAAITIASLLMNEKTEVNAYLYIGVGLLLMLTLVVALLVARTLSAIRKSGICVPDQ